MSVVPTYLTDMGPWGIPAHIGVYSGEVYFDCSRRRRMHVLKTKTTALRNSLETSPSSAQSDTSSLSRPRSLSSPQLCSKWHKQSKQATQEA